MGNTVCGHPHRHVTSRSGSQDELQGSARLDPAAEGKASQGSTCAAASEKPSEKSRKESKEKYIGAYGKLLGFLNECREKEVISVSRYADLVAAVDDLGSNGRAAVSSMHKFFQGTERDFAEVLPAMGIDIRDVKANADGVNQSKGFQRCTSEGDLTNVLEDPGFRCRGRTRGLQSDVRLIIHGFVAHYDLVDRYSIDISVLGAWIEAVATQYEASNPYHNWSHALDVFQFCHMSVFWGGAGDFFNFQDVLALLAGSIAHDVRHPGVNNDFLVSRGAPLAITYNDKSPLENMHASVLFETLSAPGNNFLSALSAHDFKNFRTKVIDAILATDMCIHFELVDKLTARLSKAKEDKDATFITNTKGNKERQQASKADRRMLLQIFMHTADLGHTCRPWAVHKELVVDLEEEFFRQGDRERELGVPIMPMMDRSKDSAATGQSFFLEKLVRPLVEPFCFFLSSDLGGCLQGNLAENQQLWGRLVEVHGKKTARELWTLEEESPDSSKARSRDGGPEAAKAAAGGKAGAAKAAWLPQRE